MVRCRMERKIDSSYFGLADMPDTPKCEKGEKEQEQEQRDDVENRAISTVPEHQQSSTHESSRSDDQRVISLAVERERSGADVTVFGSPSNDAITTAPKDEGDVVSSDEKSSTTADPLTRILMQPRWSFLYRKFLRLLRALRVLLRPLLFLFLFNFIPDSSDAYLDYVYSDYGDFLQWQFGLFKFVGLVGAMIGCIFWQKLLAPRSTNIKRIFVLTTVASACVGCSETLLATKSTQRIGMDAQTFIIVSSLLVSCFSLIAQMPPILLASHCAPKGYGLEASMFSMFAAVAHIGSLCSATLSSRLTLALGIHNKDWSNLWQLILICKALTLTPLIIMPLLLKGHDGQNEEEKAISTERPSGERQEHTQASQIAQPVSSTA